MNTYAKLSNSSVFSKLNPPPLIQEEEFKSLSLAFVTRRIEYKHLRCAQNKTCYELNLNFFQLFLCLCKFNRNSTFKCILNAYTHNIRIKCGWTRSS